MSDGYKVKANSDGSICLYGEGPMRPIAVDGETMAIARQNWLSVYGRQYEEMEQHSARMVQHMEKNETMYREMAQGIRNYKGSF